MAAAVAAGGGDGAARGGLRADPQHRTLSIRGLDWAKARGLRWTFIYKEWGGKVSVLANIGVFVAFIVFLFLFVKILCKGGGGHRGLEYSQSDPWMGWISSLASSRGPPSWSVVVPRGPLSWSPVVPR